MRRVASSHPVRDFVPVLVEKNAKKRVKHLAPHETRDSAGWRGGDGRGGRVRLWILAMRNGSAVLAKCDHVPVVG